MINFKSKIRVKILEYYFNHPDVELYLRDLARTIDEDPTNLSRDLIKLEKDGIFIATFNGKQKYFKLNKNYIFYKELKNIVAKSIGIEERLFKTLNSVKGIVVCFIYGSYANGNENMGSDIDLFVIGTKIKQDELTEKINSMEKQISREINYRFFSPADFAKAKNEKNSFIINVLKNKKVFLIGDEKKIGKLNKAGAAR
jgi:predicted nucleotidyltransferase